MHELEEASYRRLPDGLLRDITARGGHRHYPARTVIIHEGDQADLLFIILAGRVKVFASNEAGREVILNHHGPGEFVGELSLDGGRRSASVMTLEPTQCVQVTGHSLRQFIAEHPDFGHFLVRHLMGRVRSLTRNVKRLALDDVYVRVTSLLLSLAQTTEDNTRIVREKLTQQDMADQVGASREMVSRIMKSLLQGGYIRKEAHGMSIVKNLPPRW